jgi:hypothetical protein
MFLTVLSVVGVEYYVLLWPFHRDMIVNAPGECYGYTTIYSPGFGSSRFDCMGNRHPDSQVGRLSRSTTPQEDVIEYPRSDPHYNRRRGPR